MAKRKNVSILASAAGWIGSFVGELIPALQQQGISENEIHSMVNEAGNRNIVAMTAAIAQCFKKNYPVVIDYNDSIEQLIKFSGLIWEFGDKLKMEEYLNSKIFPNKHSGKEMIQIEFVSSDVFEINSDKDILSQYLNKFRYRGYRAATAHEILSLSMFFPFVQMRSSIVALGSVGISKHGLKSVLALGYQDNQRTIGLILPDEGPFLDCQMAVVRK